MLRFRRPAGHMSDVSVATLTHRLAVSPDPTLTIAAVTSRIDIGNG